MCRNLEQVPTMHSICAALRGIRLRWEIIFEGLHAALHWQSCKKIKMPNTSTLNVITDRQIQCTKATYNLCYCVLSPCSIKIGLNPFSGHALSLSLSHTHHNIKNVCMTKSVQFTVLTSSHIWSRPTNLHVIQREKRKGKNTTSITLSLFCCNNTHAHTLARSDRHTQARMHTQKETTLVFNYQHAYG